MQIPHQFIREGKFLLVAPLPRNDCTTLFCFNSKSSLKYIKKRESRLKNYFICFSNTNLIFDHKMNILNASSILILYVVDSLYTFQQ